MDIFQLFTHKAKCSFRNISASCQIVVSIHNLARLVLIENDRPGTDLLRCPSSLQDIANGIVTGMTGIFVNPAPFHAGHR